MFIFINRSLQFTKVMVAALTSLVESSFAGSMSLLTQVRENRLVRL